MKPWVMDIQENKVEEDLHLLLLGQLQHLHQRLLLFLCSPHKLQTMADRAFSAIWTSLPDHLRAPESLDSFKKGLKTFLFRKAFYGPP